MDLLIRAVNANDAESIVKLLDPIIRAGVYTIMTQPISVADQLEFIRGLPDRSVYLAAVDAHGQRVLGIQDVQPVSTEAALEHVGEISTFVAMAAHRRGIGRRLCEATLAEASVRGFRKIMATVRADNPGAVGFYRRQSFTVIGTARRHALVHGRYVDEIMLERLI